VVATLANSPFFLSSAEAKYAEGGFQWRYGLTGSIAAAATYFTFVIISLVLSRRTLQVKLEANALPPGSDLWRFRWLRHLLLLIAAFIAQDSLVSITLVIKGFYPFWVLNLSYTGYSLMIYAVAYLMVVHREGFLGPLNRAVKEKQAKLTLEPQEANALVARLQRLMVSENLYRKDNLSLEGLAGRLALSRHHLSGLINQHLGMSFHDFVNSYRIEEAKELLQRGEDAPGRLEIASAVGFGSSASFYRAFKKHAGMTPRQLVTLRRAELAARRVEAG